MKPLGIDLEALAKGRTLSADFTPDCPGAYIRVTIEDFDGMVKGGELFVTERKTIPRDGYGSARVECRQSVEQLLGTSSGHKQFYGLCRSCSKLEADTRETLRQRAKLKGGQ